MKAKQLFQEFSEKHEAQLPFSLQYKWWNEVVKYSWDVAILLNRDMVYGIMPYFIRKKGPWVFIANAHFTPYTGPFLIYPEGQKTASRIAFEHKAHQDLVAQLPPFSEFSQNFHLGFQNALTFQWNGFTETNRYTYLLPLEKSEDDLWKGLRENTRRQIKKAKKTINYSTSEDPKLLQKLLSDSFENKIESSYFERLVVFIDKYKCGKMWKADEGKETHSILFCMWDSTSAYYLIGGNASAHKNSGAMSLLTWEAIKYCKSINLPIFNFEGSSVASIEKYFRGFGGELVSFRRIEKKNSTSLQVAKKLKGS